jgi:CheY-like chemotaxis protein
VPGDGPGPRRQAALGAAEERHRLELATTLEAGSRLAGDVAHDLNDLLTAITGHAELLIASLDPSGASIQDAQEIRRAVLSAARLTRPLRHLGGGRRASGDVLDNHAGTVATTVLVVEDDSRVRELIAVVLTRAGYEIVAVGGAHAALDVLRRQPEIALMLVDVVMPEMDGYDLMTEARKIARDVHVVFMSGFACDPVRHPLGDGFLAKPFSVESLTAIVHATLGRQ